MKKRTVSNNLIMAGLFVCFLVAAIIIIVTTKRPKTKAPLDVPAASSNDQNAPVSTLPTASHRSQPTALPKTNIKLSEVVKTATSWSSEFDMYSNKQAPDVTLTDLQGQKHQLSQYRGKPVVLVIWSPKGSSTPQLQALQALKDSGAAPNLVVLALTYQMAFPPVNEETVRQYAQAHPGITFPLCVAPPDSIASPFNQVEFAPCTFFITPEGHIKIAALGLVPQDDIKSLLAAQ